MSVLKQTVQGIYLLLLAGFIFFGTDYSVYSQNTADSVINRFISRQADDAEAEEYHEARKVVRGDLNRDGKPDLAVLYTLEGLYGGNNYSQYLAVFLGNGRTFRYLTRDVVGGKLFRNLLFKSFSNGRINFDTQEYLETDGACCPSKKGKTTFILAGRKLKEL